jgi:predicted metal-dependent enzyme (double-stranded beta helix superfamily)
MTATEESDSILSRLAKNQVRIVDRLAAHSRRLSEVSALIDELVDQEEATEPHSEQMAEFDGKLNALIDIVAHMQDDMKQRELRDK